MSLPWKIAEQKQKARVNTLHCGCSASAASTEVGRTHLEQIYTTFDLEIPPLDNILYSSGTDMSQSHVKA